MLRLFAFALTIVLQLHETSCQTLSSQYRNYSVVLVGGGLDDNNTEVWNTIISLGGGINVARFGVISAASDDPCCGPDSSWMYYRDQLYRYGAAYVYYIPITVNNTEMNSDPSVVQEVNTLTGFFFGGGDQQRIVYSFQF